MAGSMTLAAAQIVAYARAKEWPDPVPEYEFHPERKWRFDWAFPRQMVAIELHGAVHQQGRHTRGKGFSNDREKMNEAQAMGWRVFEITYAQLSKGMLWAWLDKVMSKAA